MSWRSRRAAAMTLEWLTASAAGDCPLCGDASPKITVCRSPSVVERRRWMTLLRCPACGVVFADDLAAVDYAVGDFQQKYIAHYVEQGGGFDATIEPFSRALPASIGRFLDVGCGYGFALDYARFAFGWEVQGVDPSALAAAGCGDLALPIASACLTPALDLGRPFDLVLASEVIEHVADPVGLLKAIRGKMSAGGLLALTTPNAEALRADAPPTDSWRAASPGLHLVIFTAATLRQALHGAGFTQVRIEATPHTLRAFALGAGGDAGALADTARHIARPRQLVRRYLASRARQAPAGSLAASGFAYRHFKACVNDGAREEAAASFAQLRAVQRARYGLDLEKPREIARLVAGSRTSRVVSDGRLPANLGGGLYFAGLLALQGGDPAGTAAAYLAAAAAACSKIDRAWSARGVADAETEEILLLARKHLPFAVAAAAPERAVAALAELAEVLPATSFRAARAETFIRLVNAGAYGAAEKLAREVTEALDLGGLQSAGDRAGDEEAPRRATVALDTLFCLGMLALQTGRAAQAAAFFGLGARRLEALMRDRTPGGDLGGAATATAEANTARLATLRFHEGLGLAGAGLETAASPAVEAAGASGRPAAILTAAGPLLPATPDTSGARRGAPPDSEPVLLIAERFAATVACLSSLVLPLDVAARGDRPRLQVVVAAESAPLTWRAMTLAEPGLRRDESLRLLFAPFASAAGDRFVLGVLALPDREPEPGHAGSRRESAAVGGMTGVVDRLRIAAAGRPSIVLACGGGDLQRDDGRLLTGDGGMAALRASGRTLPTAHGLDAFWCDAHGVYLRGWVHAFEHRVTGLEISAGGRSARVTDFADRPDLLVHYPQYAHVRHAGFAVYLDCPPGRPLQVTVETESGATSFPLELPHGPLPELPALRDKGPLASPVAAARFAELVNALGGIVVELGMRTATPGLGPADAHRRGLYRGVRAIGLDIHPGRNVDLVGDAHALTSFLRPGSVSGFYSSAVLEHIEAPWLVAAEINRLLRPGGVTLHAAPASWPAHAEPNDFWRFSAQGLAALFGPQTGFEVLAASMEGPLVLTPAPAWRADHLEMPTVPGFGMSYVLARKVRDLAPGAVAWPADRAASESRARLYPVAGLAGSLEAGSA